MADNLDPELIRELNESLRSMTDNIQSMIPAMILHTKIMQENNGMVKGNSKAYDNATAVVDEYLKAVNKKTRAEQEASKAEEELNKVRALQKQSYEQLKAGMTAFSNAIMSTTGGMSKYNQGIGNLTNSAASLFKSFGPLGMVIGGVVKVLGFLVQAVNKQNDDILKASDTFSSFGNAGALSTTEIKEMGRAAGYSTEQLDSYANIIKGIGPDLLVLGTTVNQGTRAFADASKMNEEQLAYYRRLGITQEQYNKYQGDAIKLLRASGTQVTDQMKTSGKLRQITDSYIESLLTLEALTGKEGEALKQQQDAALASMNIQIELAQQDEKIRALRDKGLTDEANRLEANRNNIKEALTVAKEKLSADEFVAFQSALATGTWTELNAKLANTSPDLLEFAKGIKEGKKSAAEVGPYFAEGTKRAVQWYGDAGKLTNDLSFAGKGLESFKNLADQGGRTYAENVALTQKNLDEEKKKREALKKSGQDPLLDLRSEQEKAERRARLAMDMLGDLVRGPVVGALQSFMKALAWAGKGIAKMSDKLFGTQIAHLFETSDDVAEQMKGTTDKLKKNEEELTDIQKIRQNPEEAKKQAEENFRIAAKERDEKLILMEKARDAYRQESDEAKKAIKLKELESATAEFNLAKTKSDKEAKRKAEIEAMTTQKGLDKLKEREAQLLKQKLDTEKELNEEEAKLLDKQVQEGKITAEEAYQRKRKLGLLGEEKPMTTGGQSAIKEAMAGKESGGNYNIFAGDKAGTNNNLTEMSIADVMKQQSMRPNEKSAAGKYQFMASTLKGLTDKYKIDTSAKFDPAMQEKLADLLVQENQASLKGAGESASAGNTYLAHFLGAQGAVTFLRALRANPNAPASTGMSEAAFKNNPGVVFDKSRNRERTLAEVYDKMAGGIDRAVAAAESQKGGTQVAQNQLPNNEGRAANDPRRVDIPKAKTGGYLEGPETGYLAELHGKELVVPMDRLAEVTKETLNNAMFKDLFNKAVSSTPSEVTKETLNNAIFKDLFNKAVSSTPSAAGLAKDYGMSEPMIETSFGKDNASVMQSALKELIDSQKSSLASALTEIRTVMAEGLDKIALASKVESTDSGQEMSDSMLEKLDDLIEVMTSQRDTTKELLTYSRV